MVRASFRNNPLLAALLGVLVSGLGHLYLRRWLRALGWLGATVVASVLFVPDSTISAISSGTLTDPLSALPIILIGAASIFDAYLVARIQQMETKEIDDLQALGTERNDTIIECPACGKAVDPDLDFCHWCTTEFEGTDVTEQHQLDEYNSN